MVLAFVTVGQGFDIESLRLAGVELTRDPLHLYSAVNGDTALGDLELRRWPYPPGILPWLALALRGGEVSGLPFHGIVQLAPIVADALIAWLVQHFLGLKGRDDRTRLGAAALVAGGPSFWAISGYHGQIDSVAILGAVAAFVAWEHLPSSRRALVAGLLIGVGGSVKTVPLFTVVALLPSVRSAREGATLLGATAAVPLLALTPFLVADFGGVRAALGYTGGPGLGGVTMLAQPDLARAVLTNRFGGEISGLVTVLHDHAGEIVLATLAGVGAFIMRFRPPPAQAATLLWLAFYVTTPAFFFQYVVWGLPFYIMAGYLKQATLVQILLVPGALVFYLLPWESNDVALLYVPAMALVWIAWVTGFVAQARRIARGLHRSPPPVAA